MNGVYEAAVEVQEFFDSQHWRYCIIGAVAVARWGQPRATQDVDVSLLTGFGDEASYIDAILAQFTPRIADARDFAIESRTLLISSSNGVAIDVVLAAFPFEEQMVDQATRFEFAEGVELVTALAEDMIVMKAFAGRPRDWDDVEGIVIRQGVALDWSHIIAQLTTLSELAEDVEMLTRLDEIRLRADEPPDSLSAINEVC